MFRYYTTVGPALIKDRRSKKATLLNASTHFKAQFYKEIHHIHLEKITKT